MKRPAPINTRRLVIAAMLAALTAVGSALRITLPLAIGGFTSFHLGNILCALCGILLGPWLGGLSAGMGSAIYDMMNPMYISEAWITFLTKGVYAIAAGLVAGKNPGHFRSTLAALAGAVSYGVIYLAKGYFYDGLFLSGLTRESAWFTVIDKVPATIFNGAVAVIFAPVLATAIRKALEQSRGKL